VAGRTRDQAGQDLQQRRLTATAGTNQRDEAALLGGEGDVGERRDGRCVGFVGFRKFARLDDRRSGHSATFAYCQRPTRASHRRMASLIRIVTTEMKTVAAISRLTS